MSKIYLICDNVSINKLTLSKHRLLIVDQIWILRFTPRIKEEQ